VAGVYGFHPSNESPFQFFFKTTKKSVEILAMGEFKVRVLGLEWKNDAP